VRQVRDQLTSLKDWWDELNDVYSTVAQAAVMRIEDSIKALSVEAERLQRGQSQLEGPKDFRSFTYIQSGFEFDSKNGQPVLSLSKLADIPLIKHRAIPDAETVKEITIKRSQPVNGSLHSPSAIKRLLRNRPTQIDVSGIDVGILKYAHDTDGTAVESLDLSDERERLERAQHDLSQKERGSANWERQRQVVAERHADLKRKRRDFLHKLSNYYATEYDLVAVEASTRRSWSNSPGNSRNRAGAAWGTFLRMLEYKCEREGTHFAEVDPRNTTKACASCGVKTDKPLWVREHSCPSCGFEADRDANAAWNILSRGLKNIGSGSLRINACGDCAPLRTPLCLQSASSKQEAPSPEVKDFGLAVRTRRVLTTPQGANGVSRERVGEVVHRRRPRSS